MEHVADPFGSSVEEPEPGPPRPEFDQLRRDAVHGVAHSLRTPLSLAAASAELLETSEDLGAGDRERVASLLASLAQLRTHVELLAEVGDWPTHDELDRVELPGVLAEVAARHAADAADRGVAVTVEDREPVVVTARQDVLLWALETLVADLVARMDPGGSVELVTSTDADAASEVLLLARPGAGPNSDGDPAPPGRLTQVAQDVIAAWATVLRSPTDDGGEQVMVRFQTESPGRIANQAVETRDPAEPATTIRPEGDSDDHGVAPPQGPAGSLLVLVVEDDPALNDFLVQTLSSDHRVVGVRTAEDALVAARRDRPDLVICDIMLPGVSGEALVHALESLDEYRDVPIIVLTGRTDNALRVRLLQDGADDYMTKPFAVEELRIRMANLANQQLDLGALRTKAERAEALSGQLQQALESRIFIEQAKAFVAADRGIDVDEAFELLRRQARSSQQRLHDVAAAVVLAHGASQDPQQLGEHARTR